MARTKGSKNIRSLKRKRRRNDFRMRELRHLRPTSQEYWEEVLVREGVGMSKGLDTRLVYTLNNMQMGDT